jgi:hypothetical protein
MRSVLASLREYFGKVFGRWIAYLPGFIGGVEWALAHVIQIPQFPPWFWLSLFGAGLVIAQYLAFEDVRKQRDNAINRLAARELASFVLLGRPIWSVVAFPYNSETGGVYQFPEREHYRGNPEVRIFISGDFQAMAHGGTNGGYLYEITWSERNPPTPLSVLFPDIPDRGVAVQPRQTISFKPTVRVASDRIRFSEVLNTLREGGPDPILVASYRRKADDATRQSELVLPRADMLQAVLNWAKLYPTLSG